MATDPLERAREEFLAALAAAGRDAARVEAVRVRFAGRRSGLLRDLEEALKTLPREAKPAYGKALNELKKLVEERLAAAQAQAEAAGRRPQALDVTLPGRRPRVGALHPVTLVRREIEEIFLRMGYSVADGPEAEDDWHNFEALNFPPDHPARDSQDTFFLAGGRLLRTHTSPVQIRTMETTPPPIRVIIPGRVYRCDSDLRHSPMFHQVEGLAVGEGITFANLKATLEAFVHVLFDPRLAVRFRPSFFPFTEPSAEVDITCVLCLGKGCPMCSGSGWIEILGAGMVDPRVLRACNLDPERYSGFAFGCGLDRVALLKYRLPDLRLLFAGDERLLRQFEGVAR
ncbi:MAG: phenylalanine--tRNA ligase subunit alpha [Thermoanaerobaculaceae bacterium]|nr:phenylalanine--tRNA ligase subunit alpha [Thermoanaerobaculaceae bacterium]TAM45275.1 MAG: phenylalanine--tRNA ligase subunit alpha [Acidobacteriota bacterium]